MKKNSLKFIATIALSFSAFAAIQSVSNYNDVANAADGSWNLVTDSSSLSVGDQVVIAASGYDIAMSTEQRSNNRGSVAVTKSGDSLIINDSVQIITLEEGSSSSYFALSTGEGYLYAASTSSNHLKTNATKKSGSGDFSISVDSTGVATIKANQSAKNWLRFNSSNSPQLFSCYSSGQADICLYEFIESSSGVVTPVVSVAGSSYIQVGETVNFEATLTNITGEVTWSSTNEDVATVSAGAVTAKTMGTTTITADVNGTSGSKEIKVYPAENTEITIGEAIEVCKLTGTENSPYSYSATGEIISIDSAYDSGYDNVSFTISDGTNSIKCFRVEGGSELTVGTEVKVTGKLVNYNGNTPEFIQGTTYEAVVNGKLDTPVVSFDEENKLISWTSVEGATSYTLYVLDEEANEVVNTTVSATSYDVSEFANGSYTVSVVAKGNASYEPSDEGYSEFTLALSASEQVAVIETKTSLGFGYTETTVNGEETWNKLSALSEDMSGKYKIAYDTYYAGAVYSSGKYYTNVSSLNDAITFTFTKVGENYTIFDNNSNKYLSWSSGNNINEVDTLDDNSYWTISYNGEFFAIKNITTIEDRYLQANTNSGQERFSVYKNTQKHLDLYKLSGGSITTYTFSDLRMRFAATISAEVYDSLNITGAGFVVEVEGYSKTMEFDCTGKFTTDENGDYYILASLWQIPEEEYDTVITATAFIEVDGTRHFATETSYSVNSIVDEYLSGSLLDADTKALVQAFKDQELAA